MLEEYNKCKNKLEEIYDNILEGVKVRSKILINEEGEKWSKFFLNFLKPIQGIIITLLRMRGWGRAKISIPLYQYFLCNF